jgi:hypothetical protein
MQIHPFSITLDSPNFHDVVNTRSCEDISLLEIVQGADPSFFMCICELEYWLTFLSMPKIDWAILAGSYKSLQIDCSHSVYGIVMAFEYDFGLFLCLPCNYLAIVAWSNEIVSIEAINVQYLWIMLVKSFN